MRHRDFRRAESLYQRCIDTDRADGRAWLGLARLCASRGEKDDARRIFHDGVSASVKNPFLLQAWGVFEEREGKLERAKGLYEAALRADEGHCASWVALGLWEARYGRDAYKARECFRTGAEGSDGSHNYYIWHVWGVLERSLGEVDEARRLFQKGVDINPANGSTYVVWAALEEEEGNYAEAIALFEKAEKASPKNVHALIAHAAAIERGPEKDLEKARSLLTRALRVKRRDASVFQAAGALEMRLGDHEAARKLFQAGVTAASRHAPVWLAWAVMEERVGNLARAREVFQEGVWANPNSRDVGRLWNAWAGLERRAGRIPAARKLFGHGLRAAPDSAPLLASWAAMEAGQRAMPFARDMLERAVKLEPNRVEFWKLYECLELEFGKASRAQAVHTRAQSAELQVGSRLVVSKPLPGDFAAGGMWIDAADVRRAADVASSTSGASGADQSSSGSDGDSAFVATDEARGSAQTGFTSSDEADSQPSVVESPEEDSVAMGAEHFLSLIACMNESSDGRAWD